MMPIAPLMIEHRLIEKMVRLMEGELHKIDQGGEADPVFIERAVDFFKTYADRCHHGKEEDILFRDLSQKKLSLEHKRIMDELINEHIFGRKTVGRLVDAKEKYTQGMADAQKEIVECLKLLVELYPAHIEKEDKHFFIPCMAYFTRKEQEQVLEEGWEFDRKMIHEKHQNIVKLHGFMVRPCPWVCLRLRGRSDSRRAQGRRLTISSCRVPWSGTLSRKPFIHGFMVRPCPSTTSGW